CSSLCGLGLLLNSFPPLASAPRPWRSGRRTTQGALLMRRIFKPELVGPELVGLILVGVLLGYSTSASADACSDAVKAANTYSDAGLDRLNAILAKGNKPGANEAAILCEFAQAELEVYTHFLPLQQQRAEKACGSSLKTKCHSECVQKHISDARADVAKYCAPANQPKPAPQPANCHT